jgi:hypothetical protein
MFARWDFSGSQNMEGSMLYRGDLKVFWVIDPVQKTYFELPAVSPEDKDVRLGLLAFLYAVARNTLPAGRKAELDRVLGLMPLPEILLDFQPEGNGKAGRVSCSRYGAFFNGVKRADYFTAGAPALKLPEGDFASLEGMLGACMRLYDNFDFLFPDPASTPGGRKRYEGVPLKWSFTREGKTTFLVEFKSVERKDFDPAKFQLPAGLKKVEVFDLLLSK